jgi:hypothetical protein
MSRRGLYKRHVYRRHRLAAFLAVLVAVRRAMHRVAALHRLFRRRHGSAIHRVPRDRSNQGQAQNYLQKVHFYQARRLERLSQDRLSRPLGRLTLPVQTIDATPSNALIRHCFPMSIDLFGSTRSKPSQGSAPADLTLASDLAFVFSANRVRLECCVDPLKPPFFIAKPHQDQWPVMGVALLARFMALSGGWHR